MLKVRTLPGDDPAEHLSEEEKLLQVIEDEAHLLFYFNRPCVILGRNNREEEWVFADAIRDAGIPLLRRVSGGGTVYHDQGTLNYSLVMARERFDQLRDRAKPMDYFRRLVIDALAPPGLNLDAAWLSDINLNGRKISGNAARLTRHAVLMHGTMLLTVDFAAIERFLKIPPNRAGIPHREFVTSLELERAKITSEELMRALVEGAAGTLKEQL
jgi:lipoate-protein ligase A